MTCMIYIVDHSALYYLVLEHSYRQCFFSTKNLLYLKLIRASTVKCVEKHSLSTFINRLQPNPCTPTSTEKQSQPPLVIEHFLPLLKGNMAPVV